MPRWKGYRKSTLICLLKVQIPHPNKPKGTANKKELLVKESHGEEDKKRIQVGKQHWMTI